MSASTTMQRQLQRTRDNERRHSTATHPNSTLMRFCLNRMTTMTRRRRQRLLARKAWNKMRRSRSTAWCSASSPAVCRQLSSVRLSAAAPFTACRLRLYVIIRFAWLWQFSDYPSSSSSIRRRHSSLTALFQRGGRARPGGKFFWFVELDSCDYNLPVYVL